MTHRNNILRCNFYLFTFYFLIALDCSSQTGPESVKTSTLNIGISAISVNSIQAKALSFEYPIRDYVFDESSHMVFLSGKEQGEQTDQVLVKGFFAGIDKTNTVKWMVESSLYEFDLKDHQLFISNESRSVKINKPAGYDEVKYPGKIILTLNGAASGLLYADKDKNKLTCIDTKTGSEKWQAMVPGGNDWLDYKQLNDSVILILAAGLHAVDINKGLLWSYPLTTAISTLKSLTHSPAKPLTIEKISRVIHTAVEENLTTQLASNIFIEQEKVTIASKDKCVALNFKGEELWNLDLRNYPISKMMIARSDSGILLMNLGLAMHSDRFVRWGEPFILEINPDDGKIIRQLDLSKIENLVDFIQLNDSYVFAGKSEILYTKPGASDLKSLLSINQNTYGKFVEFIDGDEYYTFKEGYYVPLNFVNGNLVYFKTDNNKVYGIDGEYIQYEYHFSELFKNLGKFDNKTILRADKKTILISENYELMFELYSVAPLIISPENIYFIEENRILIVGKENLR